MWEFIDKAVYINLDHRSDRREIMNQFFKDSQIPLEKVERFPAIRHQIGIIGCAMGHIQILKKAKREGWKSILILEDDMKCLDIENNYPRLEQLVNSQHWDVCMLTGVYMETTLPKVHISFCTNAYIVKSHYYDTLLHNFETGLGLKLNPPGFINFSLLSKDREKRRLEFIDTQNQYNIDVYWFKLQLRDNWIAMMPPFCEQVTTFSDIYGKVWAHNQIDKDQLYHYMVKPVKESILNGTL